MTIVCVLCVNNGDARSVICHLSRYSANTKR